MNIWAKMMTALRGGINEAGETIVDSQALRILDQEIRDASEELNQSKESLVAIIARETLAKEKVSQLSKQIEEHEGYAIKALEQGDESLAQEVAEKIANLENQKLVELEASKQFSDSANSLKNSINHTEANLKRLKQQVDTVKATESVQRAQEVIAERHAGSDSKLRTAMDSLERIKEKQALKSATLNAAKELAQETGDESLQNKLEKAGIVAGENNAKDILEKLKQKSKK